jgi:hypothetical protein
VRIVIGGVAAVVLSVALLQHTGRGNSAVQAAQKSSHVAVIPGFTAPRYTGYHGVPAFPASDPRLSAYHFTPVSANQVTTTLLKQYDTVLLYGIRWSDLSTTARQAINVFARTGKVLIWDSDGTGPQSYAGFVRPFSTSSSGENFAGKVNDSVVSFPGGENFLASSNPQSPYYLDPKALETNKDLINDMNAMKTGTSGWVPALVAANKTIPKGGWPIAWTYGVIGDHTGLAVYSGIDADAFTDPGNPNYAVKELSLQLGAKFLTTPDTACAPGCGLPSSSGGKPFAACSFAKRVPTGWKHGRVPLVLKTSAVSGITGKVVTKSGQVVASGSEHTTGVLKLVVHTKQLPSNRAARLWAWVLVNGQQACVRKFRLKVDNTPPRLLLLATSRSGGSAVVKLRVSEKAAAQIFGHGLKPRRHPWVLSAHRLYYLRVSARTRAARLVLTDRAGNRLVRRLVWR